MYIVVMCFFFFQAEDGIRDYKVTGVQTCALPIYRALGRERVVIRRVWAGAKRDSRPHFRCSGVDHRRNGEAKRVTRVACLVDDEQDRKSTRLNSSHLVISYAVFCLKKKKEDNINHANQTYVITYHYLLRPYHTTY